METPIFILWIEGGCQICLVSTLEENEEKATYN